jgi:hypothetical protein
MSLKGKAVVVVTTTVKPGKEVKPTYQPGTTVLQYVATYADDKGLVLAITPNRTEWLEDGAVILNQRQAVGLRKFAAESQAFLGFTATTESLGHIHDRTFQVKATEAVVKWVGDNCHIGGKTQIAFFKAMHQADKSTRKAHRQAFDKAFAAELANI